MKALVLFELVPDDFECGTQWVDLVGENSDTVGEIWQFDAKTTESIMDRIEREMVSPKMMSLNKP